MRLNKDNVADKDKDLALNIRNHLVNGQFVIGNPGLGLKKTLMELENRRDSRVFANTDWIMKDAQLNARIAMTKAGIEGEESLCEYLGKLLKYDASLRGIVAFASLSYEQENNDKDYIPDTDTLLVYGHNILIVDAKNLKTKPGHPIMLMDGSIVDEKGKEIIPVHPSTHIWTKVMQRANIPLDSIDGYVCVVNDNETDIIRNDEWEHSHTKLIHISELHEILTEWVVGKDNTFYLDMLTEVAKAQIKEEKSLDLDIDNIKKRFGL